MGLEPLFDAGDIDAGFDRFQMSINQQILDNFRYAGEDFITRARDEGNYRNFTGNLRSSIGYVIGLDGQVIESAFPGESAEGKNQGVEMAEAVIRTSKGYVLVVVAGMEYAAIVESKGKFVLTKFSPGAAKLVKKLFDQ